MSKQIDNVTLDELEKNFPGEGFERFRKIAEIGGFGTPTKDHNGGLDPAYRGGLDIKGLREVKGSESKVARIEKLATPEEKAAETDATTEQSDTEKTAPRGRNKQQEAK